MPSFSGRGRLPASRTGCAHPSESSVARTRRSRPWSGTEEGLQRLTRSVFEDDLYCIDHLAVARGRREARDVLEHRLEVIRTIQAFSLAARIGCIGATWPSSIVGRRHALPHRCRRYAEILD